MCGYYQQLQVPIKFSANCFKSQIHVANFDVGFNASLKSGLIVFLENRFLSLINFKVVC